MSKKSPKHLSKNIDDLIPYARNSRTHSDEQVAQIAASIKEFGWTNPVLIDEAGMIIAGHGRVLGARKLGETEIPCIELSHLSEAQKKAYIIADNKLALNAGWDDEMLRIEIGELQDLDFDISLMGFSDIELESILDPTEQNTEEDNYSRKIEAPTYEPKGDKPIFKDVYDRTKTEQLIGEIMAVDMPDPLREFLLSAAERHTVFNFDQIAEFYCHATAEVQELMEKSALVIIDYDQAVEGGFVEMSKALLKLAGGDEDE